MTSLNLFEHQEKFLLDNKRRTMCIWETGTGKTITAIEWAKRHRAIAPKSIIICPKTLKTNWERNIKKYGAGYSFDVYSKEEFKKVWRALPIYDNIVIDEAHFFANHKSQLSKALNGYIASHRVEDVLGLTATPYMSSPWNIYSLGLLMGKKWSWLYFRKTFFVDIDMGGAFPVPVVRDNAKDLLLPLIEELGNTVKLNECVDVPDDNMVVEYFRKTNPQKAFIKGLFEPHHLTFWTKVHQAMGGVVKQSEYDDELYIHLKSEKFERVVELALQIPKPIIVCRYNGEINRIEEEIRAQGKKTFIINGSVDDKQSVLDAMNLEDEAVLLVNAACSEGWQLPSADTIIFYSYDFSLKNLIQMRGRIQRIDNIKKCTYISLITEDSVDEDIYQSLEIEKMDFQVDIYSK